MKTWQIIALTGTIVFLFAGMLPFVSAQFMGMTFSISLFDFYGLVGGSNSTGLLANYTPQAIMAPPSFGAELLVTMVLFPIVVIAGFISVIRPKVTILAGILGVLCWLGSLLAVLQLKSLISQQGTLGALAAGSIQIGSGVYMGILGAVILLASYFAAIREARAVAAPPVPQAPLALSFQLVDCLLGLRCAGRHILKTWCLSAVLREAWMRNLYESCLLSHDNKPFA